MILAATSVDNSAAPGTLAFIIVFGMAVLLVFLFRSMSKHIRRVNDAARSTASASDETGRAAASDLTDQAAKR